MLVWESGGADGGPDLRDRGQGHARLLCPVCIPARQRESSRSQPASQLVSLYPQGRNWHSLASRQTSQIRRCYPVDVGMPLPVLVAPAISSSRRTRFPLLRCDVVRGRGDVPRDETAAAISWAE